MPERIALQERIKFGVESIFGSVGGSWVYEQLGLAEYLEERLGRAETVELVAVKESLEECVLRIGRRCPSVARNRDESHRNQ